MEKIKISFGDPRYIINQHKHTVTCIVRYEIKGNPKVMAMIRSLMAANDIWPKFEAVGVAYLSPGDTYNEEAGLSVARAKAESNAYFHVQRCIDRTVCEFMGIMPSLQEFENKCTGVIDHNNRYISSF